MTNDEIRKWFGILLSLAGALAVAIMLSGCATIKTPNGLEIRYVKMPFLDSDVATVYRHEWLDKDNVLHEESLTINADMRAEHQLKAMEAGLAAGAALYGVRGAP